MDKYQIWYCNRFNLDEISEYLKALEGKDFNLTKNHELFITWAVAKFLQSQKKREHFVGFPTLESGPRLKVSDFLESQLALNNENFDTVIIDSEDFDTPIRIQIKRYMNVENASTDKLFDYIVQNAKQYGNAPEINLVFDVQQNMRIDLRSFGERLKGQMFQVASIWVFCRMSSSPRGCCLFQAYPKFNGQLWSPGGKWKETSL